MTERMKYPPDAASIKVWGYDEYASFSEQDEDLVLGEAEYFPALAQLGLDASCPKADYALEIMDFKLMFDVLRSREADTVAELLESTIALLSGSARPKVLEFLRINKLRLALLRGEDNISAERALELGAAALIGIQRSTAELSLVDEGSNWLIQLTVPFREYQEHLKINKRFGSYVYLKGDPWA